MENIRTLLVDDDTMFLEQAKIYLERDDEIECIKALSPEEGIKELDEEDIDVIVSDYEMPTTDGLEFLKMIREERDEDTPFIMFTGKGREEVAMDALNFGADRYLQKGGEVKSQFGVLAQAIRQEFKHYSIEELLELTQYSVDRGDLEVYWTTPKGKITYVNKTVADHLGYSKDEMEGMNVWKVSPDFSKDMWEEHWYELKDEGVLNFESKHETKDGKIYPVEITSQYIEHKGKEYEFAFAKDITEEKRKEKELKESKQKYEKMFYKSPIGALHYDENGVITECNKKFVDIIGSSREDLIGFDMLNNLENEVLLEELKSSLETGEGFYEGKYTSVTGGKTSWVRVFFKTIKTMSGERDFGIGLVEDITEKEEHYQELKRKEKYLDHTPIFINVVDEEGDIKYHSYPSGEGSGLDSEKLIGSDAMDYVHPDDREKTMEIFEKVIENPDETHTAEIRAKGDDGWMWLELNVVNRFDDPEIEGLIVTAQNITEKKEAREEMKKSNERYETLFEENPESVVEMDEEFRVLRINSHFGKLFGFEEDEIKGKYLNDLIVPEDKQEEAEDLDIKAKEGYINHETVRVDKEGDEIPVSITSRPIEQNDETHHIAVYRDITERKRVERKLKENERKLKQLYEIAPKIEKLEDPKELYNLIIDTAREILDFDVCSVHIKEGEELVVKASTEKKLVEKHSMHISKGVAGKTFRNKENYIVREVQKEKDAEPTDSDFQSAISIPMGDIGVFQALSYKKNYYDEMDLELADLFVSYTTESIKRMNTAKALKESEKKFRGIFEASPDPTFLLDKESVFKDVNDAVLEKLGYDKEEIVGKELQEAPFMGEEAIEKTVENFRKRMKGEEIPPYEIEMISKDGDILYAEVNAKTFIEEGFEGEIVIGRDITERKAVMKRIEEHKNKMGKLHEISAELQSYDSEEDVYSLVIEAAEDILDFDICSIDAVEGDKFVVKGISSNTSEDGSVERRIEEGGLDSKSYLNQKSYLIDDLSADKDAKPVKNEYRSAISVPVGKYGVFQAVSKETNHFDEEELRITELFASHISEALNRIKAKNREEFLHSLLRHDVGNMIQVIQGYVQLLEKDIGDERVVDMVQETEKATKNAQNLIEKVRTLRDVMAEEEIKSIEVCSALESVVLDHKERAKDKTIRFDCENEDIEVRGGSLLKEAFSNILENALDHAECDEIRTSIETENGDVIVRIEDDGKGIPDDNKDKIFERGYKSGETGGSGLGLYLVNEIITGYGGHLDVQDSEMGGALFRVSLQKENR